METGNMEGFPYDVYKKPELVVRCEIIQNAINLTEQGKVVYYMFKNVKFPDMKGLHLENVIGDEEWLNIDLYVSQGVKERFTIQHRGIQKQFYYFFKYLKKSGYVYNAQETADYMKMVVGEYQERLKEKLE